MDICSNDFSSSIIIGTKQSHRKIKSQYWICLDDVYYDFDREQISKIDAIKFVIASDSSILDANHDDQTLLLKDQANNKHPDAFIDTCLKSDSGVASLRFAHLLGLNPIYVIGLGDQMHNGRFYFHNDSVIPVDKQKTTYAKKSPNVVAYINELIAMGTKIFSCSPISSLNKIVPFVELKQAIQDHRVIK